MDKKTTDEQILTKFCILTSFLFPGASGRVTLNKDSDREPDFRIMDLDADGFLNVVGLVFWSLVNDSLKIVSKISSTK